VIGGAVVRQEKAYPVYDESYAAHVAAMRDDLEARFPTLHMVGRNGMHRYNNQDHAMMTAMLTVENIKAGARIYDIWQVNEDAEYHEAGDEGERAGVTRPAIRPLPFRPCARFRTKSPPKNVPRTGRRLMIDLCAPRPCAIWASAWWRWARIWGRFWGCSMPGWRRRWLRLWPMGWAWRCIGPVGAGGV
jgi:hypothetical protein